MKWFSVVVALLLALSGARAQGPDDQYIQIYNLIQEADKLVDDLQPADALPKYVEAQTALQRFQKGYPQWNPTVIGYRLSDVKSKIAALSPKVPGATNAIPEAAAPAAPAPATAPPTAPAAAAPAPVAPPPAAPAAAAPAAVVTPPAAPAAEAPAPAAAVPAPAAAVPSSAATNAAPPPAASPAPAPKPAPSDWEAQLGALRDQSLQLQADKAVLEAKLKEALSVQPAAVDPRELAKAEEKIRNLQKENDLLRVSLDEVKMKPAPAPDTKALDETRQALAEADRKLAEQTKAANALALEKASLQAKLDHLAASPPNAAELEASKQALQQANLKLDAQSRVAADLAHDREALQARLKTLSADAEAAAALRTENQLLKKQLADLKAAPPPEDKAAQVRRQLAEAQTQIAALQSDKEMLRLEKRALEDRIKKMPTPPAVTTPAPAPTQSADAARIKQLEKERDDLRKQLAAANKELNSRKGKAAAARMAEIESQLAALRARLEAYEARRAPYTEEEMALLKAPETKLVQADRKDSKPSATEPPPGTVELMAEARRFYASRQLDKAEEKFIQVLQQDNKNVRTLANLAAIQLDEGHLETAEINIKQAVGLAPEDSYSLFVLGRLRFQQKRYDEAVDALSRAGKVDPQDAQIQNFLGLALSEKGMRGPAEAALRRAIQIDPGYGSAHNNLAVAYITQQPPLVELAKWHYQKALAAGLPRNPELEKMLNAKQPASSGQ
jgi:Tfp pilus assembly protein PilF